MWNLFEKMHQKFYFKNHNLYEIIRIVHFKVFFIHTFMFFSKNKYVNIIISINVTIDKMRSIKSTSWNWIFRLSTGFVQKSDIYTPTSQDSTNHSTPWLQKYTVYILPRCNYAELSNLCGSCYADWIVWCNCRRISLWVNCQFCKWLRLGDLQAALKSQILGDHQSCDFTERQVAIKFWLWPRDCVSCPKYSAPKAEGKCTYVAKKFLTYL